LPAVEEPAQERLGPLVLRTVEHFRGGPLFDDAPTVHEDDAIGRLTGKGDFVRHHDHREAAAGELPHSAEDLADQLGIQSGGRFVEKQPVVFHGERTGDGNPLLLAAGELARVGLGAVSEADLFEEPLRPVNRDGPHLPLGGKPGPR
jgi:hypothetical protein